MKNLAPLPALRLISIALLGALFATASFAHAAAGSDGTYATADNNYRIEVKFTPGKLTVVEPNKISDYTQRADTGIYTFTNPTNGIAYVLEVAADGKALKAYKPGSPENFTPLNLVAASPSKSAATTPPAGIVRIPVQNPKALNPDLEELWGTRTIEGVNLVGPYAENRTGPFIQLNADGKGIFQMWGAPKPEHVYAINWWVHANADGTLVKTEHAAATAYTLIVEFTDKPYQGQNFDRLSLIVQKADDGRIFILDRSKPKNAP